MIGMSREDALIKAKIAKNAELNDDMFEAMKFLATNFNDLNYQENQMLEKAYQTKIFKLFRSQRQIQSMKKYFKGQKTNKQYIFIQDYQIKIKKDIQKYCLQLIFLLDFQFKRQKLSAEQQVFYHTAKAILNNYLADQVAQNQSEEYKSIKTNVQSQYTKALKFVQQLKPTNIVRLKFYLKYCQFIYQYKNDPKLSNNLSKKVFDLAIAQYESLPEDEAKKSVVFMQLIRDNLTLWDYDYQPN